MTAGVTWAAAGVSGETYRSLSTREEKSMLGQDDFLKILIAQLRHQDPLQPMQDREFIAQMTAFSTLEQILKLNQSFGEVRAMLMIGKTVFYTKLDQDGRLAEGYGIVQAVAYKNGKTNLLLDNGETIDVSSVTRVEG